MPLYEYSCPDCNNKFEAWKTFNTRTWATCPKCGKDGKKIFSAPNWTSTWVLDSLKDDVPRRWEDPYH